MSLHPVVPLLLLGGLAAVAVVVRLVLLRRVLRTAMGRREALWRWAGLTAATLLLIGAAARPVFGTEPDLTQIAGADAPNVFLLVDRSADMAVADGDRGRTRMDAARDDLAAVIDRYPDARFAVIGFAARPSTDWPLSADVWSLRPVVSALSPYPPTPDDEFQLNAAAAANVLRYQLIGASQQYPRAANIVFYLGTGTNGSRSPQRDFDLPQASVDGGAVLGYGSTAGGPVPGTDGERSAIDEQALGAVARQIGVPYVHRDGSAPLAAALPTADANPDAAPGRTAPPPRTETYWIFAISAAALLLVELYVVLRDLRRTRLMTADVVV